MNGTCFQDPTGFIKFSISPELMDKDLLHKIFVSLSEIKQELYAKSFQINDLRENLPPHVENARRKPQTWHERLVTWPRAVRFAVTLAIWEETLPNVGWGFGPRCCQQCTGEKYLGDCHKALKAGGSLLERNYRRRRERPFCGMWSLTFRSHPRGMVGPRNTTINDIPAQTKGFLYSYEHLNNFRTSRTFILTDFSVY